MTAEQIVRAEIAAWARNDVDEVISHFADDATFDIGPDWPALTGRAAIHEMMKVFFAGGAVRRSGDRVPRGGRRRRPDGTPRPLDRGRHADELARDGGVRGERREDHRLAGVLLPAQTVLTAASSDVDDHLSDRASVGHVTKRRGGVRQWVGGADVWCHRAGRE